MTSSQADPNLAVLAEAAFHRLGDYESLVFEDRAYRSGELFDRACRASSGLVKLGVAAGERVVVLMANGPEVGIAYSAIWRAGAVVTPVVFLVSPPELRHILADSGAVAVVTTAELLATVAAAAAGAPRLRHVIVVGGVPDSLPGHVRGVDFADLESAPAAEIVRVADDDLAALMYTGGTTGRAKGVMLSHRNLYSCSRSSHEASQADGITRALTPLPLSHAGSGPGAAGQGGRLGHSLITCRSSTPCRWPSALVRVRHGCFDVVVDAGRSQQSVRAALVETSM
jgi:long-chain acyl-CoA synthetase